MDRFIGTRIHLFLSPTLFPTLAMAQLPDPGLTIDPQRTALVITDPQNDFLSPEGVTWSLVGASVQANGTVANIETLMHSINISERKGTLTTAGFEGSGANWLEVYKPLINKPYCDDTHLRIGFSSTNL